MNVIDKKEIAEKYYQKRHVPSNYRMMSSIGFVSTTVCLVGIDEIGRCIEIPSHTNSADANGLTVFRVQLHDGVVDARLHYLQ